MTDVTAQAFREAADATLKGMSAILTDAMNDQIHGEERDGAWQVWLQHEHTLQMLLLAAAEQREQLDRYKRLALEQDKRLLQKTVTITNPLWGAVTKARLEAERDEARQCLEQVREQLDASEQQLAAIRRFVTARRNWADYTAFELAERLTNEVLTAPTIPLNQARSYVLRNESAEQREQCDRLEELQYQYDADRDEWRKQMAEQREQLDLAYAELKRLTDPVSTGTLEAQIATLTAERDKTVTVLTHERDEARAKLNEMYTARDGRSNY